MKTILITGGAGFIGSHLCEQFLADGERVICLDNFLTGNVENIKRFEKNARFRLIQHDISNHIKIDEKIDAVLHFASPASPADYQRLPIQTLKVGSLGTHNALGLSKEKRSVFLLASTSEIYGDPLVHPQHESYWGNVNPIGPRGVYDEAKRFAEALVLAYHRTHGMDVKIARIFNTYGPRMRRDDGRAIPNFIAQALANQPITIYGDGSQTRTVCYIDDMVEGIYRLLYSSCNDPVNLGGVEELTICAIAKLIVDLTGSRSTLEFHPLPEADPRARKPDITRARDMLGWNPLVGVREGLRRTIAYFQSFKAVERP